jgi:hypothetical protein
MSPAGNTPDARLDQDWGWGKRLGLELHDDELRVTWREGRDESRWKAPVGWLDEHTSEVWTRRRGLLMAAIVIFGVAVVVALPIVGDVLDGRGAWSLLVVPGFIALVGVAFLVAWLASWDHKIVLYDGRDGQHVVTVHGGIPSANAVQEFLGRVLSEARRHWRRVEEDSLASAAAVYTASEIRRFHELRERGMLAPEEFERKKRELIDAFTRR